VKFGFVAKHRGIWPVDVQCEALGVSRSGFHAWLTRAPSRRAGADEEIGAKVRASFLAADNPAIAPLLRDADNRYPGWEPLPAIAAWVLNMMAVLLWFQEEALRLLSNTRRAISVQLLPFQ